MKTLKRFACATTTLTALSFASPGSSAAQGRAVAAAIIVAPQYPPIAIQARVQGSVLVLDIDFAGVPRGVTVKRTLPLLGDSAREAARSWRFPERSGRSQEVTVEFAPDDVDVRDSTTPRVQFEPPQQGDGDGAPAVGSCVWAPGWGLLPRNDHEASVNCPFALASSANGE